MRSTVNPLAVTACLLLLAFGPGGSQAEPDRDHVQPAWGKPVDGIRAGLVAEKTVFESGDRHYIPLVLLIRNDSRRKATLLHGGSCHGWWWEFRLVGGGSPFVARWDDDTAGPPRPPRTIVLHPGASERVQGLFRQRSFNKWGAGYCSLVPGTYRVSAKYTEWLPGTTPRKVGRQVTSGTVEIEIRPRGNDWDKVATGDAMTLVGLLGDEDRLLRQAAAAFLTEKGNAASPALIQGLENGNGWARAACAQLLGGLRKDAELVAVKALARALRDSDPHVRVEAAQSLGLMGETAKPAVPALISAARNRHGGTLPNVQPFAAEALGSIGDARSEVVATIVELLRDDRIRNDGNAFPRVARALGYLGPEARDAVPALLQQLQDRAHEDRHSILFALQGIRSGAVAAVPTLVRILEDETESIGIRAGAAFALGRAGAKEALPALERVRDKCLSVPHEDAALKVFLIRIRGAIAAIHRAESQLPAKPSDAGVAQPSNTPDGQVSVEGTRDAGSHVITYIATRIGIVVLVVGILFLGAYGFYRYRFPFGKYHRYDKQLWSALREYAEAHGGKFPSGEATPEASLSLLGRDYAYLLVRRGESVEVVEQMLDRGELLGPETCGWNYVEGLSLDSNPKLALFWDKEGLSEVGCRLPGGGHFVSYVGWAHEYVPASEWDSFLAEQRRLLAAEKEEVSGEGLAQPDDVRRAGNAKAGQP